MLRNEVPRLKFLSDKIHVYSLKANHTKSNHLCAALIISYINVKIILVEIVVHVATFELSLMAFSPEAWPMKVSIR